ncbi:GxxExxY protein [Marinilabiliaceae bacterium JC017]|nr:GxxExxY protein [Marinilabiliaceae bacterium JC017]
MNHKEFPLKDETYRIIGAAMEVHKQLGCGFLEAVYQEALEHEFHLKEIPYEREKQFTIEYKGHTLKKNYFADFVCFNFVIIELKALSALTSEHESQVFNYLKASNTKVGLLINFGEKSLRYKRIVTNHYFK